MPSRRCQSPGRNDPSPGRSRRVRSAACALAWISLLCGAGPIGAADNAGHTYQTTIEPILTAHCYDCHGDGAKKGNVAFDGFATDAERLKQRDLWLAVLKNVRAGLMPPEQKPRPSPAELRQLEEWIKEKVFAIDPANPDPGRVTLRRLNRVEYQNTIRDLMGIDFKAYEEFPPDDTGYGFDNIGDVLTISPLLLEKYLQAAETIVTRAVPSQSRVIAHQEFEGKEFKGRDDGTSADRMSFYRAATAGRTFTIGVAGTYRLKIDAMVHGAFDFDPGRCRVTIRLGDKTLSEAEHVWQDRKAVTLEIESELPAGDHELTFTVEPLVPEEQRKTSADYRVSNVRLEGPVAEELWIHPPNYARFFFRDAPPADGDERRDYCREVLRRFVGRAFRRPADEPALERLVSIAENACRDPDKTFEMGVARAMVAVLASPRFLFRMEDIAPTADPETHPFVDDHTLASRLSYFLWSTMPDDELFELAAKGELRSRLAAQTGRMLADARSQSLIRHFVGQWLEVRDVDGINIDPRMVLARDAGTDRQIERLRTRLRDLRAIPREERTAEQDEELTGLRGQFRELFRDPAVELDRELRYAMQRETEMLFEHILREDRPILEWIDNDYTFLNERLARHYGIKEVEGTEMRRVTLPKESPRGGVLTHGSVLLVTSNPTRTSPVKRGLFILDHILGTPPPPPPADVPSLEEAEALLQDREPTLRDALELHREQALCRSCHSRMDPLGLALENFNALGMWRDQERGQPIDPRGKLITGEVFETVGDLKRILATERRLDFYRCLTGKLLTYALGRGLEYYDTHAVDEIVKRLEEQDGRFSALLTGVIDSAPFQKRRRNLPEPRRDLSILTPTPTQPSPQP